MTENKRQIVPFKSLTLPKFVTSSQINNLFDYENSAHRHTSSPTIEPVLRHADCLDEFACVVHGPQRCRVGLSIAHSITNHTVHSKWSGRVGARLAQRSLCVLYWSYSSAGSCLQFVKPTVEASLCMHHLCRPPHVHTIAHAHTSRNSAPKIARATAVCTQRNQYIDQYTQLHSLNNQSAQCFTHKSPACGTVRWLGVCICCNRLCYSGCVLRSQFPAMLLRRLLWWLAAKTQYPIMIGSEWKNAYSCRAVAAYWGCCDRRFRRSQYHFIYNVNIHLFSHVTTADCHFGRFILIFCRHLNDNAQGIVSIGNRLQSSLSACYRVHCTLSCLQHSPPQSYLMRVAPSICFVMHISSNFTQSSPRHYRWTAFSALFRYSCGCSVLSTHFSGSIVSI